MAGVYTTSFILELCSGSPAGFECPDGRVAIVTDIQALNDSGEAAIMYVTFAGFGLIELVADGSSSGSGSNAQWRGKVVLSAGQSVSYFNDGFVSVSVAGYLLAA